MNTYTYLNLVSAGWTHPGQRRQLNEDSWRIAGKTDAPHLWPERGRLFAVADGMGGHAAGEVASQLAINTLFSEYYRDDQQLAPLNVRLEQAIAVANRAVYEQSLIHQSQTGMGTTLVAVVVHEDWLIVASVGDSRAYLIRSGEPRQITRDHSWVAEQVQAGMLTEEEARNHIYRSVVTRCIGHHQDVQIDTFELLLDPGDIVLLCSDGLSGQVSDKEMTQILTRENPERAVEQLIDQANKAGGPDNITAVVLYMLEPGSQVDDLSTRALTATRPAEISSSRVLPGGVSPGNQSRPLSARRLLYITIGLVLGIAILALASLGGIWALRSKWIRQLVATPALAPLVTATPTATSAPTVTGVPTATAALTNTPTATRTSTPTPTITPTLSPTATTTLTFTPTPTSTPMPTPTRTPLPSTGPQISF